MADASTPREEQPSNVAHWLRALRQTRGEGWGDWVTGWLFVGPAVLLYVTFTAYPLFRGLMIAFSDYRYLLPDHAPFNGIDNWIEMAGDDVFWASLGRSFYYAILYIILNFTIAFLVAVLISQIHAPREASAYRVISYLPVVLPIAVAMLVWKQILNPEFGYITFFLKNVLRLPSTPDLLRDATWTIPVLATVAVWKAVGSNVLLLLVGLYSINGELYEAASIDGAGWWRRLFAITVPLLAPTFTLIFVLAAGVLGAAEESLIFFGLTDAGPEGAGRLVGRYAYEVAFLQGDLRWGYAAAINLTVGLVSMAISVGIFRALRSGRI
ncbi:MAG: sugar ABC transporter permease [Chloroflexi bacterium]|nr:sugar ABC transporter permease [Chloroflexota bacterium]